jgi:hypothetical protein
MHDLHHKLHERHIEVAECDFSRLEPSNFIDRGPALRHKRWL